MPPKCYICKCYDPEKVSLFRIPDRNDEYSERGCLWLKLLNEKTQNIHKIRICSKHFLKKGPAKSGDIFDVDWLPYLDLGAFQENRKQIDLYIQEKKNNPVVPNSSHFKKCKSYEGQPNINATDNANLVSNSKNADLSKQTNARTSNEIVSLSANTNSTEKKIENDALLVAQVGSNPIKQVDCAITEENSAYQSTIFHPVEAKTYQVYDAIEELIEVNAETNSAILPQCSNEAMKTHIHKNSNGQLMLPPLKKRIIKLHEKLLFNKDIQTDLTSTDLEFLLEHYRDAVEQRNELMSKISSLVIDVPFFEKNDKKTRFYTGLKTWTLLSNFYDMIQHFLPTHFNCKLSKFQMVVLTLMKLRLNLTFTDLGYRFQIDGSTASRYFHRCIYILHKLFYNSKLLHWPEERQNLLVNTPSYFRSAFKDKITIIIDCFEIFIERSSLLRANAQAFSAYKHHLTLKYLIGITTTGVIIFISDAFGGRASDKFITEHSGLLDFLQEGDFVLTDKGFKIQEEVEVKGAYLKIPCFVKNKSQIHPTEVEQSRTYSSIRIHVERQISVLRLKYKICSDIAKMSAVSKESELYDKDLYDKIVLVCCCLVNICPTVTTNDFEV